MVGRLHCPPPSSAVHRMIHGRRSGQPLERAGGQSWVWVGRVKRVVGAPELVGSANQWIWLAGSADQWMAGKVRLGFRRECMAVLDGGALDMA